MPFLPRFWAPAAAALATGLVVAGAPAWAAPIADHHVPFPCGETWVGSTRADHSPSPRSVDFNRNPDEGAPVVASAPGIVTTAQATAKGGYGRWVVVDHGNTETTLYAHLASVTVVVGQRVDQGMMLGTVGNSGNSRGAHLHYEQKTGRDVVRAWFGGARFVYGPVTSRNCVDVPVAGNLAGDQRAEVAVFRRTNRATFRVQRPGTTPLVISFGRGFEDPVVGDWDGDGRTDVGVRNAGRRMFRLKTPGGVVKIRFGRVSDQPVSGDWDGDGRTDLGVRRSSDGTFWQRMPDGTATPIWLGDEDDVPLTGDWDGDGRTDVGVFDPTSAIFTLRTTLADGRSVLDMRQFGQPGDLPVAGDWDANGVTDLGVWTPTTATFRLQLAPQPTAARTGIRSHRFGRPR